MPTIQASTLSGAMVESGLWRVKSVNMQVGHMVQINFLSDDTKLFEYVKKQQRFECMGEYDEKGGNHTITLAFKVKTVRHMFDTKTSNVDSMVVITPMDRYVEQVMIYLLDRKKCDPRFIAAIIPPQDHQ